MADWARTSRGEVVVQAVDAVVQRRWEVAQERATKATGPDVEARVAQIRRAFTRELTVVGAAAGATAAAPGMGTVAGVAIAGGELAVTTTRSADLILTIGASHGLTGASIEERRAWVLSVLIFGETASVGLAKLASELGKGLGARATQAIPTATLQAINRKLGRTIITKYGTKRGAIAVGRLLPFGIGAVIGGGANYALTRAIGRHAHKFFSELPESTGHAIKSKSSEVAVGPVLSAKPRTIDRLPVPAVPRALKDPAVVNEREASIDQPHVAELNDWVRELRDRIEGAVVPWFDPVDGGTDAKILWLLEAPGPKATRQRGGSGFISCDNSDATAANTYDTMAEAGVNRRDVLLWNAVPYYLGDEERIRMHTSADLLDTAPFLEELVGMLPNIRTVILGGKAAQSQWARHAPPLAADWTVISCPHPSPQNVNTRPEAREQIVEAWREAAVVI